MKRQRSTEQSATILTIDSAKVLDAAHAQEVERLKASFAERQRSGRPLTHSIVQAYRRAIERTCR